MKYISVFLSVILSVVAQILVKSASLHDIYAKKWIVLILSGIIAYGVAFLFQSYVFRLFPLSKIGPSSAIAIMILVFGCGAVLFGETIQAKQIIGVILGVISVYLIMG
jgi:drug/metabolite transporter (DMT)-like permease